MKHKKLALLSLAVCAVFSTAATAADNGTIKFKGKVTGTTCIPSMGSGGPHGEVTLPNVTKSMFPNSGDIAGEKEFSINLTGCSDAAGTKVKAYFWQAGANAAGRITKTVGSGSGWTYQLRPATNPNPLVVGTSGTALITNSNDPGVDVSSGSGILKYRVSYYNEGTAITNGEMIADAAYVLYTN